MKSKTIHWIIDEHMSRSEHGGGMLEVLTAMGRQVTVLEKDFIYRSDRQIAAPDVRGIVYGSIASVRGLLKRQENLAAFAPSDRHRFTYCAAQVPREALLSDDYVIETVGQLQQASTRRGLSHLLGSQVFVRPDSGMKPFAGAIMSLDSGHDAAQLLEYFRLPREALVILASRKDIVAEYRFFVSRDRGPIACSRYNGAHRDRVREAAPVPVEVKQAASALWGEIGAGAPDALYVMDIAQTMRGLHLVELNAASTSGLYCCEPAPIISEMERIIADEDSPCI